MSVQLLEDQLLEEQLSENELSEEEQSEEHYDIVSILLTNPVYYMC